MLITTTVIDPDDGLVFWNPLKDGSDALQLAVKLKLNVNIENTCIDVYDQNLRLTREWLEGLWANGDQDPYAATCRAITRAAAEIGKAMP